MPPLLRRRVAARTHSGDTHVIRGLGLHESYQLAIQTLDQYRGTVVACRYGLPAGLARPENTESLKAKFYDAVVSVALAQPHMQTGVWGENSKKPILLRLDRFELRNHVEWVMLEGSRDPEAQYLEILQSTLDAKFTDISSRPGWRAVVLQHAGADCIDVIYVWSHTHHDGMSGKIFHEQLLRNLNSKVNPDRKFIRNDHEEPEKWIVYLPDFRDKFPPPPKDLCAFPTSVPYLVKNVFKELKPPAIFPPNNTFALWAPIKSTPFKTTFRTFTIGHELVAKIVAACREHHTTVTALLHVLVLLSLTKGLKDAKGFASRTPYNLRPILPSRPEKYPWLEPKDTMCNDVSIVDHLFDAKLVASIRAKLAGTAKPKGGVLGALEVEAEMPTRPLSADLLEIVWSTSARVRREIKARLDAGDKNDMIGIMKFAPEWKAHMKNEAKKPRPLSWLVTNVGVVDGRENGKAPADGVVQTQSAEAQGPGEGGHHPQQGGDDQEWSIRRAELLLSADVASAALQISVMTVKDEQMAVTCSWQDCVVDAGLGRCFVDDLERWLKEIGSSG
ncbi:hypothetical protein PG991_009131 [Apiospora marii]|uniref:Alcohol acetyltransferase n=1 Tax=Apiospora marii TaxID=335849 RepID=A0ABR1RKA7_9PEZI